MNELHVESVVDLAPQAAHEHLEHVCEWVVVLVPHARGDRRPIDDLIAVAHQKLEQRELLCRELDGTARASNAVCAQVDLEVGDAHGLGQRRGTAARQRVQASDELAKGERLGEIVVGARIESLDAIVDRVARGEHQHGRAHAALAQRATEVEPTASGEHDVENDHVVGAQHRARSSARECRFAHDLESVFGQSTVDDRGKLRIIFYQ